MHKTNIIKNALGCLIKKNNLCARELPGWVEIINIQSTH